MADQMQGIGGRPSQITTPQGQAEELLKQDKEQLQSRRGLLSGEDTVSLEQAQETGATYGPIPGVKVGSPYDLLRSLVIKTLQDQGVATQIDTGSEILDLQQITPEEAQQLISDDGYFGVEQTSQRIVDFAVNAFGQDPSRLKEMKAAIEDGFQQAAKVFGGELPEISHQTYTAIMDKLDAFAEGQDSGD